MVFAGLRRCEVLGLCLGDVRSGERRLLVANGKGGYQRLVPVSNRFFATLADYLNTERPADAETDRVFVVLKGPTRGQALSVKGMEQVMRDARHRARLRHGTCHELRHTCFTRLREAGMALEAIQAQAGHRSIRSTQIYLHLSNDWLADQYRRAAEAIDAQQHVGALPEGWCHDRPRRRTRASPTSSTKPRRLMTSAQHPLDNITGISAVLSGQQLGGGAYDRSR